MAEASDLEDSALPPAAPPASAPAAIGQTETAPAPGPADAAPQDTQPRAQSTDDGFDDLFPADQRAKAESFEEIFRPEERAVQPPFMSLFSDNAEEAALSRDQWSIYLQNTRVGAAITAFGHAFTGPGMTEEFQKKYKEISDALEPAQGRTDSVAQVLMRPALRDLANFTAGFTAVPVALMDALARGIYGVAEGATELTKGTGAEKLVRDIAAKIIDMEMQWGGVVPGGKTMSAAMHAAERSGVEMLEAALKPEARVRPPAETAVEIKAEAWAKERLARLNEIPDDKIHPWDEVERRWLRTDPHGELLLQAYPPLRDIVSDNRLPEPIAAARAEAVIAEGEEGYMGTRAPTEADLAARREAAADLRVREPDQSPAAPLKREEAPDIHTVARSIAPEVVDEWQQLQTRKANLNRWLDELRETREEKLESAPPPEVAALNEKIAALERRLETRKPGATTQRLTDLRAQRDAALARARSVGDNHDMALVRADLMATDLRMRDMAAEISRIYREAEDLLPPPAAEAEIPPTVAESGPVGAEPAQAATTEPPRAEAAPGAPAAAPAPVDYVQQFRDIAQKVNDQLLAAGRNPEYAKADAEVMAARYVARSRAMQGVIGTPLEIFERDGLEFRGQAAAKAKVPEFAQDGTRRTDTPEFQEWFAGSVLKNEDGAPVMLFHGTSDDIREFDFDHPNRKDSGWLGTGVYLTDDPALASTYASLKAWDVTRKPNADRNVMPMYASLKNPYYATVAEKQAMQGAGREAADAWTAELKAKGHDGVILEYGPSGGRPQGSREVVVFDRGDAKSVFNKGEWNRENPDILHQGAVSADPFFSALERGVEGLKQAKASAAEWQGILRNLKGIKAEELEWSGVQEWLAEQKGPVTREQVLEHIRANTPQIVEVTKGAAPAGTFPEGSPAANQLERMRTQLRQHGWTIEVDPDVPEVPGFLRIGGTPHMVTADEVDEVARGFAREVERLYAISDTSSSAKYSDYQLPGGENYRELLLTLPEKTKPMLVVKNPDGSVRMYTDERDIAEREAAKIGGSIENSATTTTKDKAANFRSSHWDEPNILAHIRMNDRLGPNGEKLLHLEEIQSDWHQKGRREGYQEPFTLYTPRNQKSGFYGPTFSDRAEAQAYIDALPESIRGSVQIEEQSGKTPGVPDAPFKSTWHELAFKRMLRYAAEHGYDGVTWTTGAQQAERYDLSKHIDELSYRKDSDGKVALIGKKDGRLVINTAVPENEVASAVGKELAEKIAKGEGEQEAGRAHRTFRGLDLKVGGEGMKGFYDKILRDYAGKVGKKFGAKVGDVEITQGLVSGEKFEPYQLPNGKWGVKGDSGNTAGLTWETRAEAEKEVAHYDHMAAGSPTRVHYLPITEAMRDSVMEGQPLFQKGRGGVRHAERGRSALDEGRKIVDLMRTSDASTVMHEMGHTMLGDLARDAAHPQAPAQVKADWEATKKWLGIQDAADLQAKEKDKRGRMVLTKAARAANEKFARGTERYLMEGIAPSKALARVFEQFRQWLTSIYQTVTRLRVEMTPEMREVFDRLLSAEHDRVVIAPELPLKEGLADRHEGLVSSAKTRQEADALGDQVHRETAEEAQARARRVVNELRIRRGEQPLPEPEAGGRPAQRAGDDRGVAAAGPDAGGAAGVPGPRAEFPSRTVAAQDGGRPVIPDRPRALYARVPKRPTGLIEFLKARGGVQNHNGEVKALGIGRGLIKADGLKIDDAALSAWDAGYFPGMAERPTVREFLNALEDDAKGAGRFSEHDSDAVAAYESARAHNSEVDQLATELGIEARGLTYGEFWDKVAERKSLEELGKEVEDRLGAFESRMAEADRKAQEFLESRGDAWEPDHHGDGPARTLEDLENERRQEAAARGTLEGAADVGARGSAGADQAGVQAGGGFGGYRPGDPGGDVAPRAEGVRGEAGGGAVVAKPGPEAAAGGRPGTAPADAAELVPTAGQRFDNPLPDLIDKAGNVRLDNLNSTEAVNTVLRDFAEKNGLFMDARRGVVTDTEVLEFAEALGTDANIERLRAMSVEDGVPLAARIRAGRQMLIDSAQKVFEAMNGLDEMAYLEASQRHLRIQETLSGITAEWGRAGRAFRMMADEAKTAENLSEFLQSAIGRPLHEVQAEMVLGKKLKSPLQVSKFLRDARNPTMTGRVLEVWINALLSGPKTHMANVTGIALVSVMNVMETGVASGIGQMRHLVTGTQDRVFFGEAAEQLFALRQGTVEGLEAAWAILKDENTINSLGLIERPISGQIGGMLGEVVRAPSRALAAEDAVFKAIGYRQKINQLAYRAARLEGLEGDALARRVTALKDTPTAAMMKESADFARYQTFNKELGPIGQSTQRWIASHPSFKFIAPFVRTPANIFKYTIERSPLAFASLLQERLGPEVRANLRGENGAAMRDIQLARIALGSSLLVVGYMLAAEGVGTGSGPMNPGQRAAMFREGKRPNSFHLNGENVPFGRYEPLSTFLGWGADLYAIKHPATDKEAENWATAALVAVVSNITSKAALRGPAQFFAFLNNPNLTVKGYVSSQLGSMVPSVFAQGTEAADRFDRQSREWYDRILSRLPGGRQRLMPALDVWGRPIENEQHGVMGAVVPGMPSRLTEDPVEQELKRLQYFPSRVPDKILTTRLNDVQFFAYQRISGVIARQSIEAWMAHPGWSSIPAADRREILVDVVRDAREKARGYLIATSRNTDHDIAKQALSNKQALRAQMEERARLEAE